MAREFKLRLILENIDYETKRANRRQSGRPSWYRLRSAIRADYAGKERRSRAVQKVKRSRACTTDEAVRIVEERELHRNRAIDAAESMTDEQIHAVIQEAINALPTQQLRDKAAKTGSRLLGIGQTPRQIAVCQTFARLFADRVELIESKTPRYVRCDADEPNQEEHHA